MEQLYKDTLRKVKYLKDEGFNVEQKWECELKKELEQGGEMKQFLKITNLSIHYNHVTHSTEDVRTPRNYFISVRTMRRSSKLE